MILLSYKRPQNINRILTSLKYCLFVQEIILSNNNPDLKIIDYIKIKDDRLRIINQKERCYPSIRFDLSREAKCKYLIAIDDDIFPRPKQLLALYDALRTDSRMPHGFGGQIFDEKGEKVSHFISNRNLPVEALIWIFAYTKEHVNRYFELLEKAGLDNNSLKFNEDVPLSFSGSDYARSHYVGKLENCETSNTIGIASYQEDGFGEQRKTLIQIMRKLTSRKPSTKPQINTK